MEKFLVVDGNSLINRAFYGLPPLKTLSGIQCNAVYGFINSLFSVILNESPKYVVCVFDAGKHTFRHDLYAEYKGKRDHMPEDLFSQLQDLKEMLKVMDIKTIEIPEIEADDIIGSICRKFDAQFMLLSGDKDLLQLVNENTTVWLNRKGLNDILKVDEPTLKTEFGVKPYQIIELKSIMGDSSDNIPGVAGIGKVGAMKLLNEFENLDNIYKNLDKISGSTKSKLETNKEMAYLSHTLATIKTDVDLDFSLADCEFKLPLNEEARKAMIEFDFKSLINKKELFSVESTPIEEKNLEAEKIYCSEKTEFENIKSKLGDRFALEIGEDLCLSNGLLEYVFDIQFVKDNSADFQNLFDCATEVICFDVIDTKHKLFEYNLTIKNYFDVSIAIYVANEMDAEITLLDALKLNNIKTEATTCSLFILKDIYVKKLKDLNQYELFSEIELPLVDVLFNMEINGISIDKNQIFELSKTYHKELDELTNTIYNIAGGTFNINSPKQLQNILFDKLKIEYKGKKGTSVEVLNAIAKKHEIVPYLLRYRKINKLITTYLDGMLAYISRDDKIHTTFMQRTTSTGRLSSRKPNLQNLPIRDEEGKQLRKMFTSSFDGGTLISADYNQIELRLMANFSGDENMQADYLGGKDIHSATASKIFNVELKEVTKQMRRVAKSVNFGIIYGISAYGLSQNIECSPKEAGEFINKYLEIYPKVKTYGEKCVEDARLNGYAKTLMGRVRHIPDINSSNHVVRGFAERVAKNMPLQGSASDIIKIAMVRVFNRMKENNLKSKLVLQIHDELVVDCIRGESEIVKKILKEEMERVVNLKVPLFVEIQEGETLLKD